MRTSEDRKEAADAGAAVSGESFTWQLGVSCGGEEEHDLAPDRKRFDGQWAVRPGSRAVKQALRA